MYLCYIDESGTPEASGNTSHFILAGISVPIWHWKSCDKEISVIKRKYQLQDAEIHVAWMLRQYTEQHKIPDFEKLGYAQRRAKVEQFRRAELLRLQKLPKSHAYHQAKKTYRHTDKYVHLTKAERLEIVQSIADRIGKWGFARLFAECIDKVHFDPVRNKLPIGDQAFEQVVSRFERYLQLISSGQEQQVLGLLIHDNNPTVSKKHTDLMKRFHKTGTAWTQLKNIIETPLFVDSELTSMVQIADLCAYALRRYLENNEDDLLNRIFERADTRGGVVVGVRHFTNEKCECKICVAHSPNGTR